MLGGRGLRKDHFAGALMVLVGGAAIFFARPLQLGELQDMGPGYFPTALGILLVLVGIVIVAAAGRAKEPAVLPDFPGEPTDVRSASRSAVHEGGAPDWRGWICILGAFVAFIFLFIYAGAVPATTAIALISALAERDNTWRSALGLAIFSNAVLILVFWWALRMPMHLFWWD